MQERNLYPVRALKAFARSKPWRGTVPERKKKFAAFYTALQEAYDFHAPLEFAGQLASDMEGEHSLQSYVRPDNRGPVLVDKLSVITLLFLFGVAHFRMGRNEAITWTMGAFKKFFPLSHSRLVEVNGCYFKRGHIPGRLLARSGDGENIEEGEL